ncbi:unnamed protein product [Acanthosepion pharaonis]|uniref:Uncharacterized protein n=1 Tax=Acanthosepion pharaonis TaxID=158019 RepID=A0A812CAY7_ACAPH|nr:unnamed protein product [Sepia pharaonis]
MTRTSLLFFTLFNIVFYILFFWPDPLIYSAAASNNNNNVYKSPSLVDFIRQHQADLGGSGQITREKLQDLLTNHLVQQLTQMRQATNEQTKSTKSADDVHNANKTVLEEAQQNEIQKKPQIPDTFDNATRLLNEYQLDESERMFLRLHRQALCSPIDQRQSLVRVLMNLAEICVRRSRRCRDNPMEKQWLCTHAIALLQNASEICEKALQEDPEMTDVSWFQQNLQMISTKLKPVEDNQSRILYNWLKNEEKMMETLRPLFASTPSIQSKNFPLTPSVPRQNPFPGMPCFLSSDTSSNKDNFAERLRWLAKFWRYCRDRLRNKNFKEILERLSEKVEEEMSNFETPDSPGSENNNNEKQFEDVFYLDVEEVRNIGNIKELSNVNSPVRQYSLSYELASSDVDVEGWDFFLEERKNYKFDCVIQMSPRAETEKDDTTFIIDTELSNDSQSRVMEPELISPLHEHSISLTIVRSLVKLAERLAKEEDYSKAEALYEQIYIILFEIQDSSTSVMRLRASTMKNLGMLKCKLSKGDVGVKMLKKGLQMCRDLGDSDVDNDVAIAMFELGNGYIVEKWNNESFFDIVISVIAESFEKEFSDPDNETSSSQNSQTEKEFSKDEEEKEKIDDKNIKEAVSCFEEAISILEEVSQRDEKQTDVLAKAYLKLGDCHFMMKEFNEALICFEKSWTLFNSQGQSAGRALFLDNAHVLLMLGVSSFMLHVYPRTVSVFELAYRMLRYVYGLASQNFFVGLILSLLGITYYKLKYYHKCVSVCFQAFEIFSNLYQNRLSSLPKHKFWLVCQTLYVLGNSYNVLNLQHKAIKYLSLGRSLMMSTDTADKRQHMRILQILGDCYFAQYDYKTSLEFYNEALGLADEKDSEEDFDPNQCSEDMALHNQLLSRSADAHISMRQYQNAVHYLEQARDIQDILQEDIKGDLVSTLKQLGQMHSMAGDVDKAIESYNESIEIFKEIHGKLEPEMCETLGNLATMCYVKACICEDIDQELQMILRAEQYFQDALTMEMNHCVCVKYANFLYSQGNYDDAILYLEDCLKIQTPFPNIVYGGLEKVTLPELLQEEVDAQEEVVLPASSLAYYLLILCNRLMNRASRAEKYIILLMEEAYLFQDPLLHSLLGYALMELSLFQEAALSFLEAAIMQPEYFLAMDNYCICLCVLVLYTFKQAFSFSSKIYSFPALFFSLTLSIHPPLVPFPFC